MSLDEQLESIKQAIYGVDDTTPNANTMLSNALTNQDAGAVLRAVSGNTEPAQAGLLGGGVSNVAHMTRPVNYKGQPIPPTQYELAQAEAQRVAALPVEQGGLGLPVNNTAMDRARAMGAQAHYKRPGRYMGPKQPRFQDQEEKLWLRYGDIPESGTSKHVQLGYDEGGLSVMSNLDDLGATPYSRQMIMSAMIGGDGSKGMMGRNLNVVKGKLAGTGSDGEPLINGGEFVRPATQFERAQLASDMQGVSETAYGWPMPENYREIFDAANPNYSEQFKSLPNGQLRSRFAAFNPANRDSADLLASYLMPAATTGLLGYGLLNNQDAYAR
jgi:hypothetical protein